MADKRHTPGPWRLDLIDSGMENGLAIGARVMSPAPFTGPPIAEVGSSMANARLIAAAPDLKHWVCEVLERCMLDDRAAEVANDLEREARELLARIDGIGQEGPNATLMARLRPTDG